MKKKIFGILICMLFVFTAIPAVGIMNIDVSKYESVSSDPLPDLEVYALDRDFKWFEGWFRNIGDADIRDFTMHWYVNGEEIKVIGIHHFALEPGEWDTDLEYLAEYFSYGWNTIEFCVNYGDERIEELTLDNNCKQRTDFFLFADFSTVDFFGYLTKILH